MAIVTARPGIKISVVCNGAALQEYDDDDQEPHDNVVSKYIEATSGAEFGILCELFPPWPPSRVLLKYFLDHKKVCSKFLRPVNYTRNFKYLRKGSKSLGNGQVYLHQFAFAALTVDDSTAAPVRAQLMQDIKNMGEITVKAYFVKNLRKEKVTHRALRSELTDLGAIPEKALKGSSLSHRASLGAAQPTGQSSTIRVVECEFINPLELPFATYKFKYRSRDSLKSLLVIPRTPSPVPLEERDIDTLSVEEMRELLRQQREREAAAQVVKQERGIKRERPHGRSNSLVAGADDDDEDDEISVVTQKRRRDSYRTTVNEDGMEVFDLT